MIKKYTSSKNIASIAEDIFDLVEGDLRNRMAIGTAWEEIDYPVEEKIRKTNKENIIRYLQTIFKELPNE
jgi:hypothetical protein